MFIDSYGGLEVRILAKAGRRFLDDPPGEWDRPLLTPRGAVYVGFDGDQERVVALHDELRPLNGQVRLLDTDGCVAAWPLLRPERRPTGVHDPDARDMDVHALHTGYVRGLRARGGTVRSSAPAVVLAHGSDGWTVDLPDGSPVRAPVLVDAAGAWADELARQAGAVPRGLAPMSRSIFVVARPDLPGAAGGRWSRRSASAGTPSPRGTGCSARPPTRPRSRPATRARTSR